MRSKYRIHPAIGIARLGDSPVDYFVGPEAPGIPTTWKKRGSKSSTRGKYKDKQQRIKRQGARFRIFEYTHDDAGLLIGVREVTAAEADIEWSVHLANRKAAAPKFLQSGRRNAGLREKDLVIDAGPQKISGAGRPMQRLTGSFKGVAVPLGDLLTDSAGRLIVLGGFGKSQSVPAGQRLVTYANNDDWCDDTSDGPVQATVRLHGAATRVRAEAAWVIVAPPDFAPPIENVITLYDVVYNAMTKLHPELDVHADTPVSFTKHIYPILKRATYYYWVSTLGLRGHGPGTEGDFITPAKLALLNDNTHTEDHHDHADEHAGDGAAHHHHQHSEPVGPEETRHHIFEHLRRPGGGGGDMPMLNTLEAADPVALTDYQYKLMQRWTEGDFESDWTGQETAPVTLEELPPSERPRALDRAALEACVGGGFFPGFEVGRIMRDKATYSRRRPFRISTRLEPGTLTAQMAVPWQADFRDCGSGWWPAQRPNQVIRPGQKPEQWIPIQWHRETMVARWSELGFIVKKTRGGRETFVEDERNF